MNNVLESSKLVENFLNKQRKLYESRNITYYITLYNNFHNNFFFKTNTMTDILLPIQKLIKYVSYYTFAD